MLLISVILVIQKKNPTYANTVKYLLIITSNKEGGGKIHDWTVLFLKEVPSHGDTTQLNILERFYSEV